MLLNPESISFLYEVALQDLALSPKDDKGMTDKILRDETSQPNTQTWNTEIYLRSCVADADPGSGAFLTLGPGSGMGKNQESGSGMNNPDHICESLETIF